MLGDRLKLIRKEKGLTLKVLADILHTSPGFISEVETGKKMPGSEFLLSLKRNFNIDVNWLLIGDETKTRGEVAEPAPIYLSPAEKRKLKLGKMLNRIVEEGNEKKIKAIEAQLDLLDPGEK